MMPCGYAEALALLAALVGALRGNPLTFVVWGVMNPLGVVVKSGNLPAILTV